MSNPRQVIGNRGMVRPGPHAHIQSYAQPRSYAQEADFWGGGGFTGGGGGGNPYAGYPGLGGGQFPTQQASPTGQPQGGGLASLFGGGGSAAGSSSGFNVAQIKAVIDRLGGVEAIVETFTKVRTMVASLQQMAPMIKVLLGSFGKGKAAAAGFGNEGGAARRKRRPKRKGQVAAVTRRKPRR